LRIVAPHAYNSRCRIFPSRSFFLVSASDNPSQIRFGRRPLATPKTLQLSFSIRRFFLALPSRIHPSRLCAVLAVVLLGTGSGACSNGRTDGQAGPLAAVDTPPAITHIHGLGLNPADGSLYTAAHSGLYRIRDGKASIVANRYQDTMGFTVVGPDHFLASGHPDLREDLPPLLGLLESRDAGKTWAKKSLLGDADFHVLRFSHDKIWGYDSTSSKLMVSGDGKRWDARSAVVIRDFVVSPDSADIVVASNGETLTRSEDGGLTWARTDSPDRPLLLSWESQEDLWLATVQGLVYRSADSGRTWNKRGDFSDQPQAFIAGDDVLYGATHNEVFSSKDEGRTWRSIYSEMDHE
jgi:hypothetical protein